MSSINYTNPNNQSIILKSKDNFTEIAASAAPGVEINVPEVPIPPKNEDDGTIAVYRGQVDEKFAGNWEEFFISWRFEENMKYRSLVELNQRLYDQNQELSARLKELVDRKRELEQREAAA
jgi:hypothetical protein